MAEQFSYMLTWFELFQAAQVGISRQIDNLRKGAKEAYGEPVEPWFAHIQGACGELLVARHYDWFWSGQLGNYRARDAGPVQVRSARRPTDRLCLHKRDQADQIFVLVTGEPPMMRMCGWLRAGDGQQPEFWTDPGTGRAAYFVPQHMLHPMADLRQALERR